MMCRCECYSVKRRCVTLLEVLIAMVLTAGVLSGLFGYYYAIERMGVDLTKVRRESFQRRYAQFRLAQVLPRTVSENDSKDFLFFTSDEVFSARVQGASLVFVYDRGVDIDPDFADKVLARLYLDADSKELSLAIWPAPSRWDFEQGSPPMKREVLLDDVTELSFDFFVPPSRERLPVPEGTPVETGKQRVEPEPGRWYRQWKEQYHQLPALIKIHVKRDSLKKKTGGDQEQITYAFPLVNTKKTILYRL